MSVEYYYMNDLDILYNAAVGTYMDGGKHHMKMMRAHENLEAYMQKMEHWKDTALQLSKNLGVTHSKCEKLEADYVISNRELLIKQVEIDRLTAELEKCKSIEQTRAELATKLTGSRNLEFIFVNYQRQVEKLAELRALVTYAADHASIVFDDGYGETWLDDIEKFVEPPEAD